MTIDTSTRLKPAARLIRYLRVGYLLTILILTVAILAQAFWAGLSLFDEPGWWRTHMQIGYLLGFVMLLTVVLAFIARMPVRIRWLTLFLIPLFFFQFNIARIGRAIGVSALGALHPANALLLFLLTVTLSRAAWETVRKSG